MGLRPDADGYVSINSIPVRIESFDPYHSIADAWEVVEKMRNERRLSVVGWDGNKMWADFSSKKGEWERNLEHADAAPAAICLAALRAVGAGE